MNSDFNRLICFILLIKMKINLILFFIRLEIPSINVNDKFVASFIKTIDAFTADYLSMSITNDFGPFE